MIRDGTADGSISICGDLKSGAKATEAHCILESGGRSCIAIIVFTSVVLQDLTSAIKSGAKATEAFLSREISHDIQA